MLAAPSWLHGSYSSRPDRKPPDPPAQIVWSACCPGGENQPVFRPPGDALPVFGVPAGPASGGRAVIGSPPGPQVLNRRADGVLQLRSRSAAGELSASAPQKTGPSPGGPSRRSIRHLNGSVVGRGKRPVQTPPRHFFSNPARRPAISRPPIPRTATGPTDGLTSAVQWLLAPPADFRLALRASS